MRDLYVDSCHNVLRAKIRGFNLAGQSIHNKIKKSSGVQRDYYWKLKRRVGIEARYHLIAWGLIRGKSWCAIESPADDNLPSPQRVYDIIQDNADYRTRELYTLEVVKILLSNGNKEELIQKVESEVQKNDDEKQAPNWLRELHKKFLQALTGKKS